MAEAVVEERARPVPRFYCHRCDREIDIPNRDFVCPLCTGGFVEELPLRSSNTASAAGNSSSDNASGPSSRGSLNANRFTGLDALRGEIATLLMSRNGNNVEISIDPNNRRAGGRVRSQNMDRLDNVLMDFLNSISTVDADLPFGNSEMLYLGNMGDYAWGREGIDTIVTQLLNQMETSGPPPMPKDKIAEIPIVPISEEEVNRKLQCSVCWDDFKLEEMVRKLPCTHVFHEDCIVPWLDLHGTCPICRKLLIEENEENGGGASGSRTVTRGRSLIRPPGNRRPPSSSSTHTPPPRRPQPTSQSQRSNNVFAFDDSNVDLD